MADDVLATVNADQVDMWNQRAGPTWVRCQALLDRQLDPLGLEAMRRLDLKTGERVLDIGCGCGQTSLELAERVGERGQVVGVDVSQPMLDLARARAGGAKIHFLEADAQTIDLGAASFDAAFSRFGVMFFDDPVAAFINIRGALKPAGRMAFVCWRSFAENPLLRAPIEAAAPLLPPIPPQDPNAPGPFAFHDDERLRRILSDAGFADIDISPFDLPVGCGAVADATDLALNIGPLGAMLRENPDKRPLVTQAVREAISAYETPDGVLFPAAVWIVRASAS